MHNARRAPTRQPKPGEVMWRLRDASGLEQRCELRDGARAGAGWDLAVYDGDDPLFSRRCANEEQARLLVSHAADDERRCGWS